MEQIVISGGRKLVGEVAISGAKNAALPCLAACLLTAQPCILHNVPMLHDASTIGELLSSLGVSVTEGEPGTLRVAAVDLSRREAPYELVSKMRASVLVLGPLLARCGEARVSLPGGCAIGARPIDQHLKGLAAMGADIRLEHGYIESSARHLRGATFHFDLSTVTGTENLMMAAALARGTTRLHNAACEPEVVNVAQFLRAMGAKIEGAGTREIAIEGVPELHGAEVEIMPDRIETGTYMAAAAITGGDVTLRGCRPAHLRAVSEKLREAGIRVEEGDDWVRVLGTGLWQGLDLETAPYPGFPTDMQAQMMALLSLATGLSVITESVFENRFMHVAELRRLGADITLNGNHAVVRGVEKLAGAQVMATDLRASASLVIAGLAAVGETVIDRVYHLDRGYERLVDKLEALGADVCRRIGA